MDNKELLQVADAVSKEKGLSKDEVLVALAEGMETALRKNFPEGSMVSVNIDDQTGEIKAYRIFEIVEQIENVEAQMLSSEIEDEMVVDGYVFEPFEFQMDRQKFNITKQVALQKIKQGTREHQIEDLLEQNVAIFSGIVKVSKKDQIIVDCNGLDVTLFRRNLLPRDNYKSGDKVYFTLEKEKNNYVGTRVSDQYLTEVFKREIVQIEEGDIEIVAVARNPGFRSKVVVKSLVRSLDPVKSCIGPRGSHIQQIQNYLNGESVDILAYNEDPAQLLVNAFEPVVLTNIVIDEDNQSISLAVRDEDISKAIGKGGKNIELISKLVGWKLDVVSQSEWQKNELSNDEQVVATFETGLNCDLEIAQLLVAEGFSSLEEIAYVPRNEFDVEGLDDATIDELRQNAKNTLSDPIALSKAEGAGQLLGLGFSSSEKDLLQAEQIYGIKDVADLGTFDLLDVLPEVDEEKAKNIIMLARKDDVRFQDAIEEVSEAA